jgi:hypothetical protein
MRLRVLGLSKANHGRACGAARAASFETAARRARSLRMRS